MSPGRQGSWQEDSGGSHYTSQAAPPRSPSSKESFYNYEEGRRHEGSLPHTTSPQQQNHRREEPQSSPVVLAQPSDRKYLTEEDYVLCCNIEMFGASTSDVQNSGYGESTATTVGQLGLRCIHCWKSPLAMAAYGTLFPGSINSISASLEIMAEEHFPKCTRTPPEIRETIGRKKRARTRGDEEDESLLQFCSFVLSRRTSISNMYPYKSGIRFTNNAVEAGGMGPPQWAANNHMNHQYQPFPSDERQQAQPDSNGNVSANTSNGQQQQLSVYPSNPPQNPASPLTYNQPYPPTQHPIEGHYHGQNQFHNHQHNRYDISQAFIRDAMGGWVCRYCIHIPYHYRAPKSYSQSPNPPPIQFIEHHLSLCRATMYMPPPPPMGWPPHPMMGGPHMPPHPPEDHPNHPKNFSLNNPSSNAALTAAINYLKNNATPPTSATLVFPEDKTLLTDYFYHFMQQLQLCRFSTSDRKTRGGKRENVKIGFGGLECKHCANVLGNTLSRKFFWSNVDRLANSFAEIPSHVLKCRNCPGEVKSALSQLKLRHPEQMAQLPRGSQKVFFRRMWRRMHASSDGESSEQEEGNNPTTDPRPIPKDGTGIPLAIPQDQDWLSDMDCFVRKNLQAFCSVEEENLGQVGIRCAHCSEKGVARGDAVGFPHSISAIYESVREFQRLHLECCPHLSPNLKNEFLSLKTSTSLSSVLRKYYVLAAKALGMIDTKDGIRAGGELVPISSVASIIHGDAGSLDLQNSVACESTHPEDDENKEGNKRLKIE